MDPQQEKILGGNLETLGLQATLHMLALGGKTGQLSVFASTDGSSERNALHERLDIYLRKGLIISLNTSTPLRIDLLEIFRLLRRFPRQDLQEVQNVAGDILPNVLQTLVERGMITPAERQQRIEFAFIQEIARALHWERGTFEFHTHVKVDADPTLTPLKVDQILLEAIRIDDEWGKVAHTNINRYSIPRWLPDIPVDITSLNLSQDEVNVLLLANGNIPLYAIAYALLQPEARIAATVEQLLKHQLIEVIDSQLERQLEQNLANALTVSQEVLKLDPRLPPEQRLQILIRAMGTCINKLLSHHSIFARALRGRAYAPEDEMLSYLEGIFVPLLRQVQAQYQIIETVTFHDGQIDYNELLELNKLVRGIQLETFYWEGAMAFQIMMNETFQKIISDEIGQGRGSRRLIKLWQVFTQEIADELERQRVRHNMTAPPRRATHPG